MTKALLILPLISALVFAGFSCRNGNESQENKNTSQEAGVRFTHDIPSFTLKSGQTLTEVTSGWESIDDPEAEAEAVGADETLAEEQWKGDPAQILKEIYFTGRVSGQVKNQGNHLTNLGAELRGVMAVYQDGSIGGTGEIIYNNGDHECVIDMGDNVVIICDYLNSKDGTFNITGDVVLTKNDPCAFSSDWTGNENYRYKVFFLSEDTPQEKINYINTYSGSETPADLYEMHQILHAGLFGKHHLICPNYYVSDPLQLSSHQADGTVDLEFTDDFGQFQDLREKMGL